MLINEPVNLREWEPRAAAPAYARLYTAGRPGRGTPGYGRVRRPVDNAIIDTWVAGLPAGEVLHIVSLLGKKSDGFSEYAYYPFRSCLEAGSKPSFQDWLHQRHGPRFLVHEFPTTDARGIEDDLMERIATCVRRLLHEGHTVLIIDSAGAERTARVCEQLGFQRK
jgi:hypothetical protein